jgi:tyrosinase
MAGSMVYRLPAGDPALEHMQRFRRAMAAAEAIPDNRGYNFIAGFHGAPGWYCWHHQFSRRTPLQARLFLPWHRAYLWWLEQALQDLVDDVALPWWDWTAEPRVPPAYSARRIDGEPNPLLSSRASVPSARPPINRKTRRAPAANPQARLPTAAEVVDDAHQRGVLNDTDWASFSDLVEDLHDRVHGWVGGDMGDVTTAAYDPIFFAHHCMIDRIWYLWQVRHGNGGIPRDLLDLELIPFGKRVRDVLDVQRLGYEYAASSVAIPLVGGDHG